MKHIRMGLLPSVVVIPAFLLYLVGVNVIFDLTGISLILWWILMLDFAFFALIHTLATLRTLIVFVGAKSRQPYDVSAENTFPTPHVAPIIQELHSMGFTRLGEAVTDVPLTKRSVVWHLTNPEGTHIAGVIDLGTRLFALLEFSTTYKDEAVLKTTFPMGDNQNLPSLRAQYNTTSVAATYQQHLDASSAMQVDHGAPRAFENMALYLQWGIRSRELYGRQRLSGKVIPLATRAAWWLVLVGLMIFVIIANDHTFSDGLKQTVVLAGTLFLLIEGLISWRLNRAARQIAADFAKATP